jgi:hypothetical protein
MNTIHNQIDFRSIKKTWGRLHKKITPSSQEAAPFEGYKTLEKILNHSDLNLNTDCFLYRDGQQRSSSFSTRNRVKRLSALDGRTKSFIRKEIIEKGSSLKIEQVSRFCPEINRVAKELSEHFGVTVSCNLYMTPAYSRCFGPHSDNYHIFIFQLAGKKNWKLAKPLETRSLPSKSPKTFDEQLVAGDILYLPEGAQHEAYTQEHPSIHLTFGLHPITVSTYLLEKLGKKNPTNDFFETCNKVVLAKKGSIYEAHGLDKRRIQKLTNEFKNLLVDLNKKFIDQTFRKELLDLENDTRLPFEMGIFPDTRLKLLKPLEKGADFDIPEGLLKYLNSFKKRPFFHAGELCVIAKGRVNWQQAYLLIRKLFDLGAIELVSADYNSKGDRLAAYRESILSNGFFYYVDNSKNVFLFRVGEDEGFLTIKNTNVGRFIAQLKKNRNFLNVLSKKLKNG